MSKGIIGTKETTVATLTKKDNSVKTDNSDKGAISKKERKWETL